MKEAATEDKHSQKRSPLWTKPNRRNNKEDGINRNGMIIITMTKATIMLHAECMDITIQDHMNMERRISRKKSPKKNGR